MFFRISGFFFFYFSIVGVYVIFLPKILQLLGYSAPHIGLVFAVAPLTRFLVPFFFLKHFQLKRTFFFSALGGTFVSALLFYLTIHNVWLFMIPNILLGASLGLILPFIETYSLEYLGKTHFGRSRLYGSIGFMAIGLILAKWLDDPFMGLHFFLLSVIMMIGFGLLVTLHNSDFSPNSTSHEGVLNLFKEKGFWLSLFLMQVSFGAFYNFFTIYETEHGISLETTSWLWAFGVICEIVLFYFQAPLLQRFSMLSLVKFATLMTSIRWLLLFLFPGSLFISYFSQSFHAFSFALHHTAAFSYLHSVYQNKKLAAQFYYGISFGLGGFVGALISGWAYGPYLYLSSALIAFTAFLVCKKPPKESTTTI